MTARLLSISDLENALDEAERAARVAGVVDRERDASTLVVDCGDTLAPSLLGAETDGRAALDLYEALDVDYCAFGNHDFDYGLEALREVVAGADATWLCANLEPPDEDRPLFADAGVRRWTTTTVDGDRLGLFGVTDPRILRTSGWDEAIEIGDPVPAAHEAVAALEARDVDRIVAVSHLGPTDERLREELPLDAVLGGHSHERLAETVAGTAVTKPGERGEAVARVELTDPPTATLLDTADAPVDEDLLDRLRATRRGLGLDDVVTTVAEPVRRDRPNRVPESPIGNAVADAVRRAGDADVALAGSLRSGPPLSGAVTEGDLRATVPMDNELYAGPVDGDDLRALFEDAVVEHEGVPEVTMHVSGARLRWERTTEDCRLVAAEVGEDPLDPDRTYRVASSAYTFWAPRFPTLDHELASPVGHVQDALLEYVREAGLPTETEGRMETVADELGSAALTLT